MNLGDLNFDLWMPDNLHVLGKKCTVESELCDIPLLSYKWTSSLDNVRLVALASYSVCVCVCVITDGVKTIFSPRLPEF